MTDDGLSPKRPRGQGCRATRRLSENPLHRNMVIRCSDTLYEAAVRVATSRKVTLSDYIRELIIHDVGTMDEVAGQDRLSSG